MQLISQAPGPGSTHSTIFPFHRLCFQKYFQRNWHEQSRKGKRWEATTACVVRFLQKGSGRLTGQPLAAPEAASRGYPEPRAGAGPAAVRVCAGARAGLARHWPRPLICIDASAGRRSARPGLHWLGRSRAGSRGSAGGAAGGAGRPGRAGRRGRGRRRRGTSIITR